MQGIKFAGLHDEFPEIYPLCKVKMFEKGGYVSFCGWEVASDGMCAWHLSLPREGKEPCGYAWEGKYEISIREP